MNLLLFNLKTDADDDVLGFTTDWINALAKHFNKVIVITMCTGRIKVAENVRVFSVGKEKGYSEPRRFFEFYRILLYILRTERIDVCFAHMIPLFAVMAWPLLKCWRIPILLWYTHKTVTPLLRLAALTVDQVVTASGESFRIKSSKVRVTGHGIDTERFAPASRESAGTSFTILTVGRLSPIKRVEILLEAVAILQHAELPEMHFTVLIVGGTLVESDIVYAERLKLQAERLGIKELVKFTGSVPFLEVLSCYQKADCFINLSDTDSVDKAVLEAMSCGLPVITSNKAFRGVLGEELGREWVIKNGDVRF